MTLYGIEGYQQSIPPGLQYVSGSLVIPSRRALESATKKDFRKNEYRGRLLLDPQVYLTNLDPVRFRSRCASLASYAWFECGELEFKKTAKSRVGQRAWDEKRWKIIHEHWTGKMAEGDDIDADAGAIAATQRTVGCEAIILGAPLTTNPNSDLSAEIDWLDRGIAATRKQNLLGLPVLGSVALSERVLTGIDPFENTLIDTIVDQFSTRKIDGVYVVVELGSVSGYYLADKQVFGAILRLADAFKRSGMKRVIFSYPTVAGLAAMLAGADAICLGWYQSERRLRFEDLAEDDEGGIARPAYYCHQFASEIHVGTDLMKVVKAGKLELFVDETEFTKGLIRALRDGKEPKDVAPWRYEPGNHRFARSHFYTVIGREARYIASLDQKQRFEYAKRWLSDAAERAAVMTAIAESSEPLQDRTEVLHQRGWMDTFEDFVGHPEIEWITQVETACGKAEKASRPRRRLSRFPTCSTAAASPVRSAGERSKTLRTNTRNHLSMARHLGRAEARCR